MCLKGQTQSMAGYIMRYTFAQDVGGHKISIRILFSVCPGCSTGLSPLEHEEFFCGWAVHLYYNICLYP